MRFRRRNTYVPFTVGTFVEHKNDPDIYGTVTAVQARDGTIQVRLADGTESKPLGYWLFIKSNLLELMARSARDYRGPGAPQ